MALLHSSSKFSFISSHRCNSTQPILQQLSSLLRSVTLVAEEDSAYLRANNLARSVMTVVAEKSSSQNELTQDNVLQAIDRGENVAFAFGSKPAHILGGDSRQLHSRRQLMPIKLGKVIWYPHNTCVLS